MEKFAEEVAILIAQTGPLLGQRWKLDRSLIVGRESNCDIVIADRQVSRQHARFTPTPRGVILEDLGSKNGTHHNGNPINTKVILQDGDIIQIALAQQFVYLSSDATVPLEPGEAELRVGSYPDISSRGKTIPRRLILDPRSRRVWVTPGEGSEQAPIEVLPPLSASQFRLLEVLYASPGEVISRQVLVEAVWGEEQAYTVSEQALDALVRRLRDRLSAIDPTHAYIVTVRGHGIRLDNPPL